MDKPITFCGTPVTEGELKLILDIVNRYGRLSRMELAHTVCELLQWERSTGQPKARECREFLEQLDGQGTLRLPPKRVTKTVGSRTRIPLSAAGEPTEAIHGDVSLFGPIVLEPVQTKQQRLLFRELLGRHHYLGYAVPFGAHLNYLFYAGTQVAGCMQFRSPAWRMAARDQWIGWDEPTRRQNLQQIVNQSRFLILPWVHITNLASLILSKAQRRLRQDWQDRYAIVPLLVETLVDESRYRGHCYRAANWTRLGLTSGRGRMDRAHLREGAAPKAIWVTPLVGDARTRLASAA